MADGTTLNPGTGGDTIATDDIGGVKHQMVKLEYGVLDSATLVSTTNPLPVDVTNASVADGGTLPSKGVQVGGTDGSVFQVMSTDNAGRVNTNINGTVAVSIAATQAVNQAQVAGTATDTNSGVKSAGTQRVVLATDQPQLTNALKVDGSAVTQPVSGTVTATGPLTDTQLRATPVPVSGTVTATTGGLTDTQLRATPVPVSGSFSATPASSVVSTVNSTTAVLAGAAVFTGTSEEVKDYAVIVLNVFSDQVSATDGLSIQQSSNGTNWDILDVYTIPASSGKTFTFQPAARYYRVVYTNGATLQTSFRLQTIFHYSATKLSSQRPSDAYTNETDLEQVQSFGMLYNGATWDRFRGDTTNGLDVDVTRLPALVAGSAVIGSLVANQSVNQAQVAGTTLAVNAGTNSAGVQRVTLATDQTTLTNTFGNVGLAAVSAATGLSKFHLVSAATTNATNIKASAGKLHGWYIYNSNAAARKVAFHNTAGTPTAGTGVTDSIVIPPTSAANAFTELGISFTTGIAITTVTDLTDAGTTAVGASDLVINLYYI